VRASYFGSIWATLLGRLYHEGKTVSPRGQKIRELIGVHFVLENSLNNILVHPVRNLNHRFMVAEWLWMWFGRDDVATIDRYNKQLAQFSDNGVNFNGAYGVPIKAQWQGLLDTLTRDRDSRQAVLQIYKVPHGPTRDVPCTINLQFLVRRGHLEVIANMRSSDIWLGLPYDVFNFTMFGQIMAAQLGVRPGPLSMHLGSSHLYDRDAPLASQILGQYSTEFTAVSSPRLPSAPPAWLEDVLVDPQRAAVTTFSELPPEPWQSYAAILLGRREHALDRLVHASRLHVLTDAIESSGQNDVTNS
jgi:thymidylate synthase